MAVLMMLLLLLAVALITVAVLAWYSRNRRAELAGITLGNAVLTHQSYADAGGTTRVRWSRNHSNAYDTAQKVEAKARNWIHAESIQYFLPDHVLNVQSSLPNGSYTVAAGLAA